MEIDQVTNQPPAENMQIELAITRTLLALDRTLLAWIRTSLTLIGFGFTLAKFVHSLIATGTLQIIDSKYPRQLGIALMIMGIIGLFAGAAEYYRAVSRLKTTTPVSYWSASLIICLVLAVVSLLIMGDLVKNLSS